MKLSQRAAALTNLNLDITDQLQRDASEYQSQARDIKHKLDRYPLVIVNENAGSGKSRTAGEFAKLLRAEVYGDAECERMVFATNTRSNRNAFAEANNFTVIRGTTEIIEQHGGAEAAQEAGFIYDEYSGDSYLNIVKELRDMNVITEAQAKLITADIEANRALINSSTFIAMTVAKIQVGEFIKKFRGCYVFLDEMSYDKLLYRAGEATVYGQQVKNYELVDDQPILPKHNVNDFFTNITSELVDDKMMFKSKVVLLSAEKSLSRAFESIYAPKTRYCHAGRPRTLVDDNLTVMYVKSTGNSHAAKKQTPRAKLAQLARKYDYQIIADGQDATADQAIGDFTFEGSKGHNDMTELNLMTIIGMPHPFAVANVMLALGVDEDTAVSIICSDQANQAIGRNTGYRSTGAKHIIVLPKQLSDKVDSARMLQLDTISENVFDACSKRDVDDLPDCDAKAIASELFVCDDWVISQAAEGIINWFDNMMNEMQIAEIEIPAKELKQAVKQHLADNGAATTRANRMVGKVVDELVDLGVRKTRSSAGTSYVYQSKK